MRRKHQKRNSTTAFVLLKPPLQEEEFEPLFVDPVRTSSTWRHTRKSLAQP
ncbi:hypothetical protein [Micromonospora sonchi]|nr:hypothetical protein [Micromonospora sonchi]